MAVFSDSAIRCLGVLLLVNRNLDRTTHEHAHTSFLTVESDP